MIKTKTKSQIIVIFSLCIFLVIALFPIYWMLNTSFKGQSEVYQKIPTLFPKRFTLDGYTYLFTRTPYLHSLLNSIIVATLTVFFSLFVGYPAAYALSRTRFKGRNWISRGMLFSYLIPTSVLYIPLFIFVSRVGFSDSLFGLILIYPTFTLPYTIWMLIPHLGAVPKSIEEASIMDGCSRMQTMLKIIFPLAKPGLVSTSIFAFSMCWGEFMYALVNINSTSNKTFTLVISGLIFGDIYPWGQIMAGAITACIPILLIYIFASNYLVGGVTAGAVKQ
ncbi:MAG: carbohydrate ABC transporter permease [Sphaerochaeta sp.]|nr:carbohydrate ABC transporter permease [Sphaerochaeta sp.]